MKRQYIISVLAAFCISGNANGQIPVSLNKGSAAPMSREVSNNYDNSAYTNTRNIPAYQPIQRMEVNTINTTSNTTSTINNDYRSNTSEISRNEISGQEYASLNNRNNTAGYERVANGAFNGYSDAGLRPSSNSRINPGGGVVTARYNASDRKYYYYCTSDLTKSKSKNLSKDRTSCKDNSTILRPDNDFSYWWCYPGYFNALALLNNQVVQRDLLLAPDNTSKHSNSSKYFSFDGYIVYESDTIAGIVTVTNSSVILERTVKQQGRNYYNVSLTDLLLKAIVVFKGPKELHLVRLMEQDKHLSRVVHNGKLRLYDRSYDFLTASNVGRHLQVIDQISGKKAKISSIKELAAQVNGTYSLTLNPETISRKELITIINRLD